MRHFTAQGRRLFSMGMAAIALLILAQPSIAQDIPRPPEMPREQLRTTGKVLGIRGPLLQFETAEGEKWVVQIQARPQDVEYIGNAEAGFLKPGMLVRFTAKVNKRGDATEPVDQLTLFTLREGWPVGVVSAADLGGGEGPDLFESKEEAPAPKPAPKTVETPTYQVSGQIVKISRLGEMTISAGSANVKAKLDPEAKVSVDMADFSYVMPGDEVAVEGWYYPGRKGQGIATRVSVTAKEPLVDPKKKTRKPPMTEEPAGQKEEAAEGAKPVEEKAGDAKPAEAKTEEAKPAASE